MNYFGLWFYDIGLQPTAAAENPGVAGEGQTRPRTRPPARGEPEVYHRTVATTEEPD